MVGSGDTTVVLAPCQERRPGCGDCDASGSATTTVKISDADEESLASGVDSASSALSAAAAAVGLKNALMGCSGLMSAELSDRGKLHYCTQNPINIILLIFVCTETELLPFVL